MTTTITKPTTVDPTDVRSELQHTRAEMQRAFAALPDMLDLPGTLTERQKGTERERRARLPQHISLCSTLIEQLEKAVTTRAGSVPGRDRLLAAKAAIEQRIADAPDWRSLPDGKARDAEYDRQRWLADSLSAIRQGVGIYPNTGEPALPTPLRALLIDVCPTCGHESLAWSGALPPLEEAIIEAEKVIAGMHAALASLRTSVAPWLAEAQPAPAA